MTTSDKVVNVVAAVLLRLLGKKIGYGRLIEMLQEWQRRADEKQQSKLKKT